MITAETFECTVPSANAVKKAIIYCTTDATNTADIWMAIGSIAGAVATTAAVIVALWQSKKAAEAAKRAEELSQKQFDESIQLPALHAYVRAWREITAPTATSAPSPYQRLASANLASTTWRDVNRKSPEHRDFIELLEVAIASCIGHMEPAYVEIDARDWKDSGIGQAIRALTNLASRWQSASSDERAAINGEADKEVNDLEQSYHAFVKAVREKIRSSQ